VERDAERRPARENVHFLLRADGLTGCFRALAAVLRAGLFLVAVAIERFSLLAQNNTRKQQFRTPPERHSCSAVPANGFKDKPFSCKAGLRLKGTVSE
jgi:hypothetical protein